MYRMHYLPFLPTEVVRRQDNVSVRDVGESSRRRERARLVVWMVLGDADGGKYRRSHRGPGMEMSSVQRYL